MLLVLYKLNRLVSRKRLEVTLNLVICLSESAKTQGM